MQTQTLNLQNLIHTPSNRKKKKKDDEEDGWGRRQGKDEGKEGNDDPFRNYILIVSKKILHVINKRHIQHGHYIDMYTHIHMDII